MTAGYVAPRDPTGRASLYGPPPWQFAGRSITVLARCDPSGIAALTPTPLRPWSEPIVRFSVHDLVCDLGFGWDWAQANPARACFREAVVGLAVEHEGRLGFWDPLLWTDSDAELAVGRETYGWPQRFGSISQTPPHAVRGWRVGDLATGRVSHYGEVAFDLSVRIDRTGPTDVPQPTFEGFYLERILPDPTDGSRLREVFFAKMAAVTLSDIHSGSATLALRAPELAVFGAAEPLGGQVHAVSWTKNLAERLLRERLP
jgi:acetoacetate decarboxylase